MASVSSGDLDFSQIILIDDDSLVHMFWTLATQSKGKKIACFLNLTEFKNSKDFSVTPKETPIYVDLNIEAPHDGLEVVRELGQVHKFQNLYLATGEDVPQFKNKFEFLKGVCGKDPPV